MSEPSFRETEELVRCAASADDAGLQQLFERHTARLRRMVHARLDVRLQGRLSASDVVQEVYVEATARLSEYLREPRVPFFVWLRFLTGQKLVDLQRRHLGTQARDAGREVPLHRPGAPGASSEALAEPFVSAWSSPSEKLARTELEALVQQALAALSDNDREVLVLKHFENLTNAEIAYELDIDPSAASKRYLRALARAKQVLASLPGGKEEAWTKSL